MVDSIDNIVKNASINVLLVILQLSLAIILLRYRTKQRGILSFIGKGDIVFLFALCFLFNPVYFMYNYLCGLLIGILYYLFESRILRKERQTVPLIATLGISTVVCYCTLIFNTNTKIQLFSL
ncbi:MAG TPA: hypothetical protein PKN75_12700 [Bacteroidia bacterium]|nr:hypothetical protein [Bacteroidia bacterium]